MVLRKVVITIERNQQQDKMA